jgi:cellulose biosynthesis protein BcsQ
MKKNHVLMEKLPEDRINKSKIVALMNNKGGCGKTSTSIALGMYLIRTGHNVLFWDNDPQSNLTQRLGLPDDKCEDKRINALFRSADMKGFEKDQRNLASIVEYPYIYKIKGTIANPGKVGLMAGDHNAEIEANAATQKLKNTGFSRTGPKDIFSFFDSSIRFYSSYFDYIIVDTAPAIEGNILNRLAARVADEIICPVDGIEAALGMRNFLGWLSGENNIPNNVYPNVTLAMVKYQADT